MPRPNTRLGSLAERVHNQLADATVEELHGRASLKDHNGQRRIHWLAPTGILGAPSQAGGRFAEGETTQRKPAAKTREQDIECHIFAEDVETIETLLDNFVAAMHLAGVQFERGRYRSPTQEDATLAGLVNWTEWIILTFVVKWPVVAEIQPLRKVLSVQDVCGTIQSDGTVVPQGSIPP